jgi:hypothetical protein
MLDSVLGARSPVLLIVVVAAVVLLALMAGRRGLGSDFTIKRSRGGQVSVRGRIPASKVGAIRSFFARDLGTPHAVSVRGSVGSGRSLRLQVVGRLSPGQRQQVRNFLVELLR